MPTHEETESFRHDYGSLTSTERTLLRKALEKFIADLAGIEQGSKTNFRKSLRVKDIQGSDGVWEMTWAWPDGRATFQYGTPNDSDKRHVIWRRTGGHDIFKNP